jgi:coenzyme F420-0:L-glutamate ligase/coenzyme F420-1:gamma-L-glutamate ligase
MSLTLIPITGLPDVRPGDNIAHLILAALSPLGLSFQPGDVLAVAQKIISKSEGRYVYLDEVRPGDRAREVAQTTGKDPRLVELILQESSEISRMAKNLLIVRHRLGFVSANAGIDRSNVDQENDRGDQVLLLPVDPDQSAAALRWAILEHTGIQIAVVITDSHGRPFRLGTVGVAIGVAGFAPLWDRRGEEDLYGYRLQHTEVGLGDEMAAAASLLMGQAAEATPAVIIRGLTLPGDQGSARDLVRPLNMDLYR